MSKISKSHCNKCVGMRNHIILYSDTSEWKEELDKNIWIKGGDTYDLLKCCGCDNISLRHKYWYSEHQDENGKPIIDTDYYPPAIKRNKPFWINDIFIFGLKNQYIADLLNEIYTASYNNSRKLAAMGIRALLEHIMIQKVGDQGTFGGNLNEFYKKSFISRIQKDLLETILEIGHATMHRSFHPSKNDLSKLIDIVENLIETIYVHEKDAMFLKKNIPARGKT